MFGISRNDTKILCYASGTRKSYTDPNTSKTHRTIWEDIDACLDPYLELHEWPVHSRILQLQKIYKNDKLELIKFSQEMMEDLAFRRLRGY